MWIWRRGQSAKLFGAGAGMTGLAGLAHGRTAGAGAGAGPCGEADGAGVWARSHGSTSFPVVTVWLPHCPGSAGSCEMRERFHLVEDWAWAQRPTMRSTPAPALRSA